MAVHIFTWLWIFFIVVQFQAITGNISYGDSSKERNNECPTNHRRTENGLCAKCPSGSQGKNCSTKCPENFYGEGCLKQCNCTKEQLCNSSIGCIQISRDLIRITTFETQYYRSLELFNEFNVTSSKLIPEHSTEHNPGITVKTGNIGEILVARARCQVYLRYVGGGLAVLSLMSIFGTLVLKRLGFNTKEREIAVREPVIEEVSLHTIVDVTDSSEQEAMYSNVYLEILDIESGNSNPCNVYEEISGRGSSDSQSNADCGYLEVIAVIEKEDIPVETYVSSDGPNTDNDDIQPTNADKRETESDCFTEGI